MKEGSFISFKYVFIPIQERNVQFVDLLTKCGIDFLLNTFQDAAENQHVLQHRFYEYQYQPDHDIISHITEIETLASRLSDVGAAMTDIQFITKIICTLPPSYRNFESVWDSVPVNERTISLLTSRLLKEESNALRWSRGPQDAADTAFFAQNYPSRDNP
jgi:hypothetical protein